MEEINNFIRSFFTVTIKEKEYGLRSSFLSTEGEEGYVILKKGKSGWNTKPIMNNPYVITETNMMGVIQIIDLKYSLDETHYEKIKDIIYDIVYESIGEYLNPCQ